MVVVCVGDGSEVWVDDFGLLYVPVFVFVDDVVVVVVFDVDDLVAVVVGVFGSDWIG